jgi:hypothetical protein
MVTPAVTLRVFSWYLFVLAAALILVPNHLLGLFGIPATTDVWIRVVGMLVGCLAFYYLRASQAALETFIAWTVPARLSVLLFFGAFVALGLAPAALILFGVVDALAALWTWRAFRRSPRGT